MTRPLPTSNEYTLLKPATLDLAEHIGRTLALTAVSTDAAAVAKRALFNRIAAYLNADAHKRMCAAYSAAAKGAR